MNLPEKNDIIQLEITALSHEGAGVGRYNNIATFVPATVPGDIIEAKIVKDQKRYMFARLEKIIEPSKNRVEDDCPSYPICGGCTLRNMSYPAEVEEKGKFLKDNLARIGKIDMETEATIPSPVVDRYRNKAQYPVREVDGRVRVGFYAPRSHRLIPLEDCLLQPKVYSDISNAVVKFMEEERIPPYNEVGGTGLVRHLNIRSSQNQEQVMVTVVINGSKLPSWEKLLGMLKEVCPNIKTLTLNHNTRQTNVILGKEETILYGNGIITDTLCGIELEISPLSFYQINHSATELLYAKALEYADPKPEDILLDLYCGIGAIGLSMAHRVKEVIGVEIAEEAVENAKRNSEINNITNARFINSDSGKAAKKLLADNIKPSIIILDPPRKGIDEATIEAVKEMTPDRIVYISCDTATLARDLKLFEERGYKTRKALTVDLFPRTAHVESVVLLTREG